MSEAIEYIKAAADLRKQDSKKRKAGNMAGSKGMLKSNGIDFEEKNGGVHLIVKHGDRVADFWPTTGKFNVRGDGRYFRGVRLLIKIMRGDYTEEQFKALQAAR